MGEKLAQYKREATNYEAAARAMLEEEAVLETAGYKLEEEAEEADRAAVSMVKEGAIRRSELSSLTLLLGIILFFPFGRRYFLGLLCLVEVLTYSPKTSF